MPKVVFLPSHAEIEVEPSTKILVAARRAKVDIRFGCGACRCGTCAVSLEVSKDGKLSQMQSDEQALLTRIGLVTDGSVRLSCRAKIESGACTVDIDFQNTYSPGDFEEDDGISEADEP